MATPINTLQPALGLNYFISQGGTFPPQGDGSGLDGGAGGGYIGVIGLTAINFGPQGAFFARGQSVAAADYPTLFNLIGTTYGNPGAGSFNLPDLRARLAIDAGLGAGLGTDHPLGERAGGSTVALTQANLPAQAGGTSTPFAEAQGTQATNFYVVTTGLYPTSGSPNSIGTVVQFAPGYTPPGALPADGRLLSIADFNLLYSLIGTTFGGDGLTTFALPDLRGRTVVGVDATHPLGTVYGAETSALTTANLPANMGGSGVPVSSVQPSIALNYLIATSGIFPSSQGGGSQDETIATYGQIIITLHSIVPSGYAVANGATQSISQNTALFSLLGTNYGGNGSSTFGLPDLRGVAPISVGTDPVSGFTVALGQSIGQASYTLTSAMVPALTIAGTAADNTYYGGDDSDQISGAAGNDSLTGNSGNDTLDGGAGDDTLAGGPGFDTASYASATAGVTVTLSLSSPVPQATGGSGTDLLTGIEAVIGSDFGDSLRGDTGPVTLSGGLGDDTIEGGDGANRLDGGGGRDLLTFFHATSAVTVNLAFVAQQVTGGGGLDTLSNFEDLRGSAFNDSMTGDAGANVIEGDAGDDNLNGAAGIDTASYAHAGAGVYVGLLLTGAQNTLGAGTDTLTNFENLLGSAFNDTLGGEDGANLLDGGAGNDQLYGGLGTDTLLGGNGDDVLYGGAGVDSMAGGLGDDTYVVEDSGDVVTEAGGAGFDQVYVTAAGWTPAANVEAVYLYGALAAITGSAGVDVLVANVAGIGTMLDGAGGDDVLWGRGGNDSLLGGAGNDVLRGQGGDDQLTGGTGNDQLLGGGGNDVFVFGQADWGYDQVFDFLRGEDLLDMRGSGASFAGLTIYGASGSTVVTLGAARIDVYGVASLSASDFIFS